MAHLKCFQLSSEVKCGLRQVFSCREEYTTGKCKIAKIHEDLNSFIHDCNLERNQRPSAIGSTYFSVTMTIIYSMYIIYSWLWLMYDVFILYICRNTEILRFWRGIFSIQTKLRLPRMKSRQYEVDSVEFLSQMWNLFTSESQNKTSNIGNQAEMETAEIEGVLERINLTKMELWRNGMKNF